MDALHHELSFATATLANILTIASDITTSIATCTFNPPSFLEQIHLTIDSHFMPRDLTMSSTTTKPKLSLNSSLPLPHSNTKIPQLGFGVYLSAPDVCTTSCLEALKAGYRHIDTAQYYDNEEEVGKAIRDSGIPRGEIFVTTKILFAQGSVEESLRACWESVAKIDAGEDGGEGGKSGGRGGGRKGYVDLFLIHSPNFGAEKTKEMWMALEILKKEAGTRAIGVSNFGRGQIEEVVGYAREGISVNQIEVC